MTCIRPVCGYRTDPAGKHLFVVDIALHPTHQVFNVSRRGHFGRSSVMFRILPQVLEPIVVSSRRTVVKPGRDLLVGSLHLRTRRRRTKLSNRSIEEVNLIVKVDHYTNHPLAQAWQDDSDRHTIDRKPLIQILPLGQPNSLPQTPTPKRRLGKLSQLVTAGALCGRPRLEGGSRPSIAGRC